MTVPWNSAGELLKSTIKSIALEPSDPLYAADFQPVFRDQAHENVHPGVQLELVLSITSSTDVGTGERREYDPAANGGLGAIVETMHGMRDFVLNVQARSFDVSFSTWAMTYLERIRTRIWRQSVMSALIENRIAPFSTGPITSVEGKEDGHALSIANLDLFMRLSFEDTATLNTGWFEKIELTSHIQKPDGTEYPAPPNVNDLQIPPG
jgi:hypothetical protein